MSETLATEKAIDDRAEEFLGQVLYDLQNIGNPDCHDLRDWIRDMESSDTAAMGLSFETQLHLAIEHLGDIDLEGVLLTNFREWVEGQACVAIHGRGESLALEWVDELEEFLEEHELDLGTVTTADPCERVPVHRMYERCGITVYEYQPEAGVSAEVWEFHHRLMTVFACRISEHEHEAEGDEVQENSRSEQSSVDEYGG